jgi:tRNA threonylcarbamoyladenosine biosynthesis protein TsaB
MNVLALDTATAACSAALWGGSVLRARRFVAMTRGHAEALMPMVEAVMAEAGAAYRDLDLIATTVGPGTFTGLRVGLAAARGIALAAGRPIVGVTTLEALAHGVDIAARDGRGLIAALDARRGEVYAQVFDGDLAPLSEPRAAPPGAVAASLPAGPLVLVGDGASLIAAELAGGAGDVSELDAPRLPDAAVIAALVARRFAGPDVKLPSAPPAPLYLRSSGAREPG